eukprot:CAMPEP_0198139476 /NCGR_PEP_ID=MMETSP1443-20131203/2758_1 /TAXON_ID=186043 /ORGANISM="Entomoneis sp., Strain CCMP2396" /LENGTH=272 /DNA_ID=CAMNT_0043801603 /DNA_START=121 /DNA_END=939 /DNA_ORIENTATION=-
MLFLGSLNFAHAFALAFMFFVTKQDTRKYLKSRIQYLGSTSTTTTTPARRLEAPPLSSSVTATVSSPTPRALATKSNLYLRTSSSLNMRAAETIANGAIRAAESAFGGGSKPICVTVLDKHGGVLVQKRMDDCPDGAYTKFSFVKARTCIHLNTSSRSMRQKYMEPSPSNSGGGRSTDADPSKFTQAATMVSVMQGELIPVAGGILVQDADGNTVGAVGVSGAAADEDEYCALAGVRSLLLQGDGSDDDHDDDDESLFKTIPQQHSCSTLKA